ncbi:hypothetical protein XENOCAPTIV_015211, partial [Xenoophorus captivus]
EWKDGLASPEDLSPDSLKPPGFMTASPADFTSLPYTQDTQSTGVPPDDSESILMDDTSSQWSAVADTEEERRSALEKSMYVLQELIETEKYYVADLGLIVEVNLTVCTDIHPPTLSKRTPNPNHRNPFTSLHTLVCFHPTVFSPKQIL